MSKLLFFVRSRIAGEADSGMDKNVIVSKTAQYLSINVGEGLTILEKPGKIYPSNRCPDRSANWRNRSGTYQIIHAEKGWENLF